MTMNNLNSNEPDKQFDFLEYLRECHRHYRAIEPQTATASQSGGATPRSTETCAPLNRRRVAGWGNEDRQPSCTCSACRERVIEALTDETADMTNVEAMAMLHHLARDIEAIRLAATNGVR
jgi:hypothetical protein